MIVAEGKIKAEPRVLVIEDNVTHRALLESILLAQDYQVVTSRTGEQGLARAAELQPDLIVLDLLMYPVDGWMVLQRLKESPITRDIPVVVVTIVDDGQARAQQMGARAYLHKPFQVQQLIRVVEEALPRQGSAGS